MGNYDTKRGKNFAIHVNRCIGKPNCKQPHEIDEWLEGKYLLVVENNWKFKQDEIHPERRVQKFAQMKWHPLHSSTKVDQSYMINIQEVTF